MVGSFLLPLVVVLPLSWLLERRLLPGVSGLKGRPGAALCLHAGLMLAAFALLLPLLQRPWFALALLGAFQLLLVLVNNAKYQSLREPFLVQDFEYFTDAIRHPRLYLPFFGVARTVLASLGGLLAVVAGLWLEPSLVATLGWAWVLLAALVLALGAGGLLWLGQHGLPAVTFEPARDLHRLGFYAYLWAYGRLACQPLRLQQTPFATEPLAPPKAPPHLVVVQSESFFDPRPHYPFVASEVLDGFDRVRAQALQQGRLRVPAWGANTVRTECAFLTGLTPEQLGVHRFNPYHQLSKREVPNLAATLRAAGYRTICVHPYPASFYLRDRVFPRLGFERFIGIEAFDATDRQGQYVGDRAVTRKVQSLLAEAGDAPLFIFVITMENHGPLHLETPSAEAEQRWYRQPRAPEGCRDLTVYLQHLANADNMVTELRHALAAQARGGLLCWYGDHVPIMAQVYARHGEPDGLTDYLIWSARPGVDALPAPVEMPVECLAQRLLGLAGLTAGNQSV